MRNPDFVNFEPRSDFSRRDFVTATLATGFAAAVQPVAAQTVITTDTAGLVAGEVKITVDGGPMAAYRAMPEKGAKLPTVIVVQEIFGVHEHIKDVCRRLAKAGYLAIAPDLYFRQGDVTKAADINAIRPIVAAVPDAQVMSDLDATANYAANFGGDAAKLGITGFCWGGRIVWLYAAHSPRLKAGVAWYGRVEGQGTPLQPKSPIELVGEMKAPVLGLYGGADAGIPNDGVERMRQALKAANKPSDIVLYPDMPHGFHADYRPSYRAEAAKDGWAKLLDWFRKNGVR